MSKHPLNKPIPETKRCTQCHKTLPIGRFRSYWDYKQGRESFRGKCFECESKSNSKYARKTLYDLPHDQYELMEKAQAYACKICHTVTKLVVDHDHETGKIRGLLCPNCNSGIGFLKDDPVILAAALDYLTNSGVKHG